MFALTILGNNSAIPAFNRHPTAQVLQLNNELFLIDCGEGTQSQMSKYKIRKSRISRIFISHLHGDHYFGLIGLLTSMALMGRTQRIDLHAPEALQQIIRLHLDVADTKLSFELAFHSLKEEGLIVDTDYYQVKAFHVQHRIECWGFRFNEKKNPRKVVADRARAFEIPSSFYDRLQKGEDYTNKKGTIIPNEEVTAPATRARSYAFCGDTLFDVSIAEKVKGVDMLYHETTYLKEAHLKAADRFHCTTEQAATIATLAEAKKLLIGHFSSKYELLDSFLEETKHVFKNTELALEGLCFKIGG